MNLRGFELSNLRNTGEGSSHAVGTDEQVINFSITMKF